MPTDDESLGDRKTAGDMKGAAPHRPSDKDESSGGVMAHDRQSQGDRKTLAGIPNDNTSFDDGMEVIDLSKRYTIERVLGQGGMGEVVLALDARLGRNVAIKRILGDSVRSRSAVNRFLTEARAIAALNHPNIVHIHDYGQAADGPFLIMEFVEGNSLLDRCQQGVVPIEEAVELTCQLCDALDTAHAANIIHRDIKPANILLTTAGIPKLMDFGLAKDEAADSGLSIAGAVLGTLDFMPPEQRRDVALVDNRSDLWSLAATLYQMVTGRSPRIIRFNNVPQALQDVLGKALEDEKDARYQTATEFRDALQATVDATPEVAPDVTVDLVAGECVQCHTKNDSTRKFCRECAAPLFMDCLSCRKTIPAWEKVCGECGGIQAELVVARRSELDTQRDQAESLCYELAFNESLKITREIAAVEDVRLQHLKEWAETFIAETQAEQSRQVRDAADRFEESQTHRKKFDYPSAIHALEQIPGTMRTEEMSSWLQRLPSDQEESEKLRTQLNTQRDQAESLRHEFAFDESLQIAREIAAVEDERLQQVKEWSETFITETQAEQSRLEQDAVNRFEESQTHRKTFDYPSAIHAVVQIPGAMRTEEMSSWLQQLHSDQKESDKLIRELPDQVQQRTLTVDLLLRQVDRAVVLRGDHSGMLELQELLQRQKFEVTAAFTQATSLLSQGKANEALVRIASLETQEWHSVDVTLRSRLEEIVSKEDALTALVKKSKADGVLDAEEIVTMWQATNAYLKLNPQHEKIASMLKQLVNRIQKTPKKYVNFQVLPNDIVKRSADWIEKRPSVKNSIGVQFRVVFPGTFMMGEKEATHEVTLTQPFELGVYPVTQEEYEQVIGENPSTLKEALNPVENVSWHEAVKYCRLLSKLPAEQKAGYVYRLPTEAEWEYACRAGTTTDFSFGDEDSRLKQYGWFGAKSRKRTHTVGKKKPNPWGLYDMHGLIAEWCLDWYDACMPTSSVTDPKGHPTENRGTQRVHRGGSRLNTANTCKSAHRGFCPGYIRGDSLGFRVLRWSVK